jgi:acetyl esterase/lipase
MDEASRAANISSGDEIGKASPAARPLWRRAPAPMMLDPDPHRPFPGGSMAVRKPGRAALVTLAAAVTLAGSSQAQLADRMKPGVALETGYSVAPDIVYETANNYEARLDVYRPRATEGRAPTLIYIHGGGWVEGRKEAELPRLMPYLSAGWAVVNVEYRLADVSLAPAAVEDCRCALQWIRRHAEEYGFDTTRVVVTGHSAGGHLSLTTGMLPASAGLDRQCNGTADMPVAAIVNWYGITDVADLLDGPNQKSYAVQWLSSMPDRNAVAERVSPLTYVRAGLPPIITIHGDADGVVPYGHAVRLHRALDAAGVPNRLVTIPGGGHGGFSTAEYERAYAEIGAFLQQYVVGTGGS